MLATLLSATILALEGRVIRVEVDVAPGLPGFTIVGLGDASIREARERVRGALRNSGFVHPPRRITVNLAPADVPKTGPSADLAIAMGVLIGSGQVRPRPGRIGLIGEVSLGGEIRRVPGLLPMVAALARRGVGRVVVPADGEAEARLVEGVEIVPAAVLADAVEALRVGRRAMPVQPERVELAPGTAGAGPAMASAPATPALDLADVRGQLEARRALEVALAGGHAMLMIGPPGTGKTMLARTIPGLLPALSEEEAFAATLIASVAGEGPIRELVRDAPFRAPHHTSSYAAIVGGGPGVTPGEVTRADGGVLFMDELAEFSRDVLEALRQPLEDGQVTIVRAAGAATLPARFQLVAATNPCPCGMAGEEGTDRCTCPLGLPDRYLRRLSGPLRDRIDVWVRMPRLPPIALVDGPDPEPSAVVRERIAAARARQLARPGHRLNARVSGRALRAICHLTALTSRRLTILADAERLSGRGTERLLRVARTIADLDGSEAVEARHLEEAARWRSQASRPRALAV